MWRCTSICQFMAIILRYWTSQWWPYCSQKNTMVCFFFTLSVNEQIAEGLTGHSNLTNDILCTRLLAEPGKIPSKTALIGIEDYPSLRFLLIFPFLPRATWLACESRYIFWPSIPVWLQLHATIKYRFSFQTWDSISVYVCSVTARIRLWPIFQPVTE